MRASHFRALPALNDNRARDLEEHIAEKKDSYAKPVHSVAESQVRAHAQIGERYIGPINVTDDVHDEHERKQSKRNSASCSRADVPQFMCHQACFGPVTLGRGFSETYTNRERRPSLATEAAILKNSCCLSYARSPSICRNAELLAARLILRRSAISATFLVTFSETNKVKPLCTIMRSS